MKTLDKNISINNLLKIGLLANAIEWWEFGVFSYLSITIGKLFFQAENSISELLQVFTLFAISYLIRPLGSVFFGMLGDRHGRRYSLQLSLILMAVPTVFIGCLPTYSQAGITATVMLVILRMIQGFAMGGELPSTACYVFESAPKQYKSLLCSTVGTAAKIGLLLGSLTTYLLVQYFEPQALLAWGWRLPFLLSAPLTFFIAYIRNSIQETAEFEALSAATNSLADWKAFKTPLVKGVLLCSFLNVGFPILTIWMPMYLQTFLHVPANLANLLNTFSLCMMIPFCIFFGYISQYIGYKKLFITGVLGTIVFSVPIFQAIQTATDFKSLWILQMALALLVSIGQGVFVEMIGDLFPASTRSRGFSLSFIIPASLIGGTIPLLCTHMVHTTGWLLFPAYYMVLSGLITLPVALSLPADKAD